MGRTCAWVDVILLKNIIISCIYQPLYRQYVTFLCRLYPHFTTDYFGPDSTRSLYMVDRPHIWESNRGLADNHGQSPGKVGEGLAQSPQSYESRVPKKWSATVFKHVQKSSRPEPVGPRSSWSFEGPLKVLSRLPSGAFVYPLERSSTLRSSRILSAAQSAGDLA